MEDLSKRHQGDVRTTWDASLWPGKSSNLLPLRRNAGPRTVPRLGLRTPQFGLRRHPPIDGRTVRGCAAPGLRATSQASVARGASAGARLCPSPTDAPLLQRSARRAGAPPVLQPALFTASHQYGASVQRAGHSRAEHYVRLRPIGPGLGTCSGTKMILSTLCSKGTSAPTPGHGAAHAAR